jgi:hypothetical protein
MSDLFPITLGDQIAEAEREVRMREEVYPRQVAAGRLTKARADVQLARMRAVRDTLRLVEQHGIGA